MNSLLSQMFVAAVVVSTVNIGRADVFEDQLQILAAPRPKTISLVDTQLIKLAHGRKKLIRLRDELQSLFEQGKSPDTRIRYEGRPVGTIREFDRKVKAHLQLSLLMQAKNKVILRRLEANVRTTSPGHGPSRGEPTLRNPKVGNTEFVEIGGGRSANDSGRRRAKNENPAASANVPFEVGPDGPAIGGDYFGPNWIRVR